VLFFPLHSPPDLLSLFIPDGLGPPPACCRGTVFLFLGFLFPDSCPVAAEFLNNLSRARHLVFRLLASEAQRRSFSAFFTRHTGFTTTAYDSSFPPRVPSRPAVDFFRMGCLFTPPARNPAIPFQTPCRDPSSLDYFSPGGRLFVHPPFDPPRRETDGFSDLYSPPPPLLAPEDEGFGTFPIMPTFFFFFDDSFYPFVSDLTTLSLSFFPPSLQVS